MSRRPQINGITIFLKVCLRRGSPYKKSLQFAFILGQLVVKDLGETRQLSHDLVSAHLVIHKDL